MFSSDFSGINEQADSDQAGRADDSPRSPTTQLTSVHPILDLAEYQLLEDQVGNPLTARTFASDFARLWNVRYEVLASAVERGDSAAALDAVLSMRTSSAMVGGVRLSLLAGLLEEHIQNGELGEAQPYLSEIAECGQRTVQELEGSYILRNGTPDPIA